MVELSRVELGEGRCSSEVVVDWSEELREAGSVDYSEKNPRIGLQESSRIRKNWIL
ncbi:hypothetical protein CROQUDRAFT_663854 [Cronartium quercuum f. sp. fusiforme G11]|uniref:Uncharacterized protein n=1 Tax=Cronartium quercuum f. sp. fusiforme G11 TaxID=708437 RepID=A0A9P6T716_9BASI|nr:hypothetical protein CROQUDRAFT_663854 [Cronartium quercuum f. sp. fusiforme G11]